MTLTRDLGSAWMFWMELTTMPFSQSFTVCHWASDIGSFSMKLKRMFRMSPLLLTRFWE